MASEREAIDAVLAETTPELKANLGAAHWVWAPILRLVRLVLDARARAERAEARVREREATDDLRPYCGHPYDCDCGVNEVHGRKRKPKAEAPHAE